MEVEGEEKSGEKNGWREKGQMDMVEGEVYE